MADSIPTIAATAARGLLNAGNDAARASQSLLEASTPITTAAPLSGGRIADSLPPPTADDGDLVRSVVDLTNAARAYDTSATLLTTADELQRTLIDTVDDQ